MSIKQTLETRIELYGDDAFLSTREAAHFLNIHRVTLAKWSKLKPTQPPFSKNGMFNVYRLGDLKNYLKSNLKEPT